MFTGSSELLRASFKRSHWATQTCTPFASTPFASGELACWVVQHGRCLQRWSWLFKAKRLSMYYLFVVQQQHVTSRHEKMVQRLHSQLTLASDIRAGCPNKSTKPKQNMKHYTCHPATLQLIVNCWPQARAVSHRSSSNTVTAAASAANKQAQL